MTPFQLIDTIAVVVHLNILLVIQNKSHAADRILTIAACRSPP